MLRFIAFVVVASTPDGKPVYSVADILDPLPRHNAKMLRAARFTAGERGHVLVGSVNAAYDDKKAWRRVDGFAETWSMRRGI